MFFNTYQVIKLDLRSGREVLHKDQRRRRRSSLPTVLQVPDEIVLMTPPPTKPVNTGASGADGNGPAGNAANTGTSIPLGAKAGPTGGTAQGQASGGTVPPGTKPTNTGSSRGTGTIPKSGTGASAAAAGALDAGQRGSLAAPLLASDSDQVLQITSSMLQQLLSCCHPPGFRQCPRPFSCWRTCHSA